MPERKKVPNWLENLDPPYSEKLDRQFGESYLNYPDTTGNVPPELRKIAENLGGGVRNITDLIGRSVEFAPEISCETNQRLLVASLWGYMHGKPELVSQEEFRAVMKHMEPLSLKKLTNVCPNPVCHELYRAVIMDKFYTPKQMKLAFGYLQLSL